MDFPFTLQFLNHSPNHPPGILVFTCNFHKELNYSQNEDIAKIVKQFCTIVDIMGEQSRQAQKLDKPVTTANILKHTNHKLYLISLGPNKINGILKIGTKKLFVYNEKNELTPITPTCVLDFYVVSSSQRQGVGRLLFEYMLQCEKLTPRELAYDAPSNKFLSFLKKHYGLMSYTPLSTNFVIFHEYFIPSSQSYHYKRQTLLQLVTTLSNFYQSQKTEKKSAKVVSYQSNERGPFIAENTDVKHKR
ncbi:DUF738 domain-containing protein [Reticulomyxa filosa]|uniref:Alpha-tubulin N-acetyltransferase n=1 Tax=Reticulomyxa filosa TaxID=46433 RepID=X6LY28_RETFI|nr:DUF738 domain-containing protein [Reticulomyxa filosa]|eukprot:ETO06057.1 DUF738 domain-containing protein [Reticulomyxa filosa]